MTFPTHPISARLKTLYTVTALAVFMVIAVWLRFHQWAPPYLDADDLFNYLVAHGDRFDSPMANVYFAATNEKIRFVSSAILRAEVSSFGTHMSFYLTANIFWQSAVGVALAYTVYTVSGSLLIATLAATAAAVARFSAIQVTHLVFEVETISLFCCLLSVLVVARTTLVTKDWSRKPAYLALFFAFLAFNAHERYVVLIPWLWTYFVFQKQSGGTRQRLEFAAASIGVVGLNYAIKTFVYHSIFFMGTGSAPISIDLPSFAQHFLQGLQSIFEINRGPEYLTALQWPEFPLGGKIFSAGFAIAAVALCLCAFISTRQEGTPSRRRLAGGVLALGLLLLIPAALTIRMEQRWEAAPFCMLWLLSTMGLASLRQFKGGRALGALLLAVMMVGAVATEVSVDPAKGNFFFVSGDMFARAVKETVIDGHLSPPGAPLIFVAAQGYCDGSLIDGGLFLVYEGKPRRVYCIAPDTIANPRDLPASTRMLLVTPQFTMVDITEQLRFASPTGVRSGH